MTQRMTANVAERLLETFFRRRWRNLLPFALCCAIGVATVMNQPKQYLSQGVLSASPDTLLGNLSNVGGDNSFGFDTPATVASRRINEQLRSDVFVADVAERAGLNPSLEAALIDLAFIRERVGAAPDGVNLLKVGSMTEDPELSVRLANATIDSFIQSVIDEDLGESIAAQTFYEGIASQYFVEVRAARSALDGYLLDHPAPPFGERPAAEQSEIAQLTSELDRANGQYTSALAKVEEAKLANELARLDITQRLRVVDPPVRPSAPVSGLRAMAMTLGMFIVLGLMLTAGFVTLAAFLDKTIRTADEVRPRLAVDVLATVPAVKLKELTGGR